MTPDVLTLAADVHDRLLKLVAPATPGSITASSLTPSRNPVLFVICCCAGLSFLIFIIPIIISVISRDVGDRIFLGKDLTNLLQIIGGAGLGSSFYALHTASKYIKSGTFDPNYNNTYLIRFGLGLLSGLILAYFLKDFLEIRPATLPGPENGGEPAKPDLAKIGVSALALVGGYAAEAVAQILDRLSETLVSLVSGSDKDKIDAVKVKADAEAEKKTAQTLGDTVKKLQQALSDPDPGTVKTSVHQVVQDILERK